ICMMVLGTRERVNEKCDATAVQPDRQQAGSYKSATGLSDRLDVDNLDLEGQRLAGQWVIEVNGDLLVIEGFDHAGQLTVGRIIEDDQKPFGKLHAFELATRHDLHILWVMLTKPLLRLDL